MNAFDFARYQKNNSTRFSDRRVFTQPGSKAERLTPSKSSPQFIREQTLLLDACMSLKGHNRKSKRGSGC